MQLGKLSVYIYIICLDSGIRQVYDEKTIQVFRVQQNLVGRYRVLLKIFDVKTTQQPSDVTLRDVLLSILMTPIDILIAVIDLALIDIIIENFIG